MFSTKFWFTLVALVMGAAIALLLLARNSYNSAREADTQRLLIKDRDQAWALLKTEARVRLDELLRVAGDQDVLKLLRKASLTPSKLDSDDRSKLGVSLRRQNEALESYAGDLLVAVDHEGRSIAQVWQNGPDKAGYHLTGFPAVRAALRGFMQDDIWAVSTDASNPDQIKVYRVATRPVISAGRYVGAVVHGQHLDTDFAETLSKRLSSQVVFFRGPVVIASGLPSTEGYEPVSDQMVATPLEQLLDDDEFLETGRSEIIELPDGSLAVYALAMGEASLIDEANVGYAIVRPVPAISSSLEIITAASLQDWTNLLSSSTGITLISLLVLVLVLGFLFFYLEHGRPLRSLRREVGKLASREVDRINVYGVARPYRKTAESINTAIDKAVADVAEKLGKKPASIDQILSPQPGEDRVSSALFNFPEQEEEIPPPPSSPGSSAAPPAASPKPPAPPGASPPPKPPIPGPTSSPGAPGPPPGAGAPGAPPAEASSPPSVPGPMPIAAPGIPSSSAPSVPSLYEDDDIDEDEDKTEIAGVPEELLIASQRDEPPPANEADYFQQIFEQFVATKKQCGERTDNLQFERFSQTLKRNRDSLVERYGCKSVRFQVYVKEGKAALKATPVRNS